MFCETFLVFYETFLLFWEIFLVFLEIFLVFYQTVLVFQEGIFKKKPITQQFIVQVSFYDFPSTVKAGPWDPVKPA